MPAPVAAASVGDQSARIVSARAIKGERIVVPLVPPEWIPSWTGCQPCCRHNSVDAYSLSDIADMVDSVAPSNFISGSISGTDKFAVAKRDPAPPRGPEGNLKVLSPRLQELDLVERTNVEMDNGAVYTGQLIGTQFHGEGQLTKKDGSCYRGAFRNGRAHGLGRFNNASKGEVYEGEWDWDWMQGRGTYIHVDGTVYKGEWLQDEKSGLGAEIYADGSRYEGDFLHGSKHGAGKFISADDRVLYRGNMKHDKMHGDGTYNFIDGRVFAGQWLHGHMDGQGVMLWPDGSQYKGGMKKDLRQGQGQIFWPGGRSFDGQWCNGKQEGVGIVVDKDGVEMTSLWKDGMVVKMEAKPKGPPSLLEKLAELTSGSLPETVLAGRAL